MEYGKPKLSHIGTTIVQPGNDRVIEIGQKEYWPTNSVMGEATRKRVSVQLHWHLAITQQLNGIVKHVCCHEKIWLIGRGQNRRKEDSEERALTGTNNPRIGFVVMFHGTEMAHR